MKRILSLILIISVVVCPVFTAYALTDEEKYETALEELRGFIGAYSSQQDGATIGRLDDLWGMFAGIGNFSLSRRFLDYIDVLRYIENKDYDRIARLITNLEKSSDFAKYLASLKEEGQMSLGSLSELDAYASARKAQDENNITLALYYYEQCVDFLDSYERLTALYDSFDLQNETNYNKAIQLMKQDDLDSYKEARDLLKELAKIDYLDSNGRLSTAEYKIEQLSEPEPAPKPTPEMVNGVWYERTENVMMECERAEYSGRNGDYDCLHPYGLQSGIKKLQIVSVSFVDTLKDAPRDSYDISLKGDNSVRMWFKEAGQTVTDEDKNEYIGYRAYIGANGTIYAAKSICGMFAHYVNCAEINFNNCFDTGMALDMSFMFYYCEKLTALDVSGFKTVNVTSMYCMFADCFALTTLDVSGFDTSNVTDMDSMFSLCGRITELDISKFNTKNVTRMEGMFFGLGSLTTLDLSGFDTSNVTGMNSMFSSCSSLTTLDVSWFDTSNVTGMNWMFSCCSSLTTLDVSGFDTGSVARMDTMFYGCESLSSLDVSNFDVSSIQMETGYENDSDYDEKIDNMFKNCTGLKRLVINKKLEEKMTSSSLEGVTAQISYR